MSHSSAKQQTSITMPADLDRELALARFQSEGDPVMQCLHSVSLFRSCSACDQASRAAVPAPRRAA